MEREKLLVVVNLTVYVLYHPGSMPSNSRHLWEEGMCVKSFFLVKDGIFQEEGDYRLSFGGRWGLLLIVATENVRTSV
jgi:N-methylhydantoinase B/oxoprolinase/acetone carboxylase alpha subunit